MGYLGNENEAEGNGGGQEDAEWRQSVQWRILVGTLENNGECYTNHSQDRDVVYRHANVPEEQNSISNTDVRYWELLFHLSPCPFQTRWPNKGQ